MATGFTPVESTVGGLIIGLSAASALLVHGCVPVLRTCVRPTHPGVAQHVARGSAQLLIRHATPVTPLAGKWLA